ncbi:MAG: calcium/sodium antiporter [Gemmatimonadota bacterium]
MIIDFSILALGLGCLLGGGDTLVRGASAIALRLGVAPLIIGLTVVAFGTSAPELVVNLAAAWRGTPELGFGNVVGSNIANLGLLLGGTALLAPIAVNPTLVLREIPLMAGVAALTLFLGAGIPGMEGADLFTRWDGVLLLTLFAGFLAYTATSALRQRADVFLDAATQAMDEHFHPQGRGVGGAALLVLLGLILLVAGGELAVRGATALALDLGVDEAIVGLTVLAVGTSLPELATSITAAIRGQSDVALGNIVGSNLFNLLFVWGVTVTVAPSDLPANGSVDLLVMSLFSLALIPMAMGVKCINRWEGAGLLLAYGVYVGWLAVR